MRVELTVLAMLSANAALAQDAAPMQDAASVLESCLSSADAGESCIGQVAAPCLEAAGGAADAVAACYKVEADAWRQRVDAALSTLRSDAEASDAIAAEEPTVAEPDSTAPDAATAPTPETPPAPRPSRVEALDRAQSTWLAWRDAECVWHSLGFDPQAAAAAEAECRMTRTAERALALEPRGMAVDGP